MACYRDNPNLGAHYTITMHSYQWARIHKLLVAQFPQESNRKVKSVSDKWEKIRS